MENLSLSQLQLTSLQKGKIEVRLTRKWKAKTINPDDHSCYNIVVIDHEVKFNIIAEERIHQLHPNYFVLLSCSIKECME